MHKINAIFLTHYNSLHSQITGGVQLCSQEFYDIISKNDDLNLTEYNVAYTKNILQRLQIKIGLENYSMFDIQSDISDLLKFINEKNIEIVFINMASLVRYSRPIKNKFGEKVKIVLLSHGNHSGDFLHLITKPIKQENVLQRAIKKIRLGLLISTEASHRVNYLDCVITLSETEKQIENWFGAKKALFMPRRLYSDFVNYKPVLGRIGFVGRLDHPPNFQGMQILLNALSHENHSELNVVLVGAPENYGKALQIEFPFIKYLGELTDEELKIEISTWAFLLNPVWWYSTGASTKLAKAISWGIPIITTTAGMRGYYFSTGSLLVADTPQEMSKKLLTESTNIERIIYWSNETKKVAISGKSLKDLSQLITLSLFD